MLHVEALFYLWRQGFVGLGVQHGGLKHIVERKEDAHHQRQHEVDGAVRLVSATLGPQMSDGQHAHDAWQPRQEHGAWCEGNVFKGM